MFQISVQVFLITALCLATNAPATASPQATLRALAPQGIVVPKRSALISGLNNQFKLKPSPSSSSSPSNLNLTTSNANQLAHNALNLAQLQSQAEPQKSILANFNWLNARVHNNQQRRHQQHQQQALYLDRHQQEILAANPNLLNPSNLAPSTLYTRSDAQFGADQLNNMNNATTHHQQLQSHQQTNSKQQQQLDSSGGQQLYRGFSLIELEVKSDSDRRYVQDLYGNLTAAINEQAQNPNALSVSPYVDVDFWSFKYALNDQIDIMVSPKSRAFILNQLNRAKIRHRIKIDDIQSQLDQSPSGASASPFSHNSEPLASGKSVPVPFDGTQLSGRQYNNNQAKKEQPALNGRQEEMNTSRRPQNDSMFFENYQRLADISQYLEAIVEKNRDIAQVKVIGRSSQGRYLRVLKLGYDQVDSDGSTSSASNMDRQSAAQRQPVAQNNASYILENFFKKQENVQKVGSIWLDGGTHAREWISPATVLYIAFRLSDNHNRCRKFFDTLRMVVSQADTERKARRYYGAPNIDDLLPGINEINTSLLGKPVKQSRPRTELEHTLELLAKSPQEVASEYSCDLEIEQLLRRYTFFIMPVLNPDGYEYSHTHNRLWRKTRSTSNHPIYRHFCLGADPNRNYDARHGSTGSSTHPCSQTYAGSVPFTEPETRHQSNFVYANRANLKMFISFHSYSQMILLPYSHSTQLAPDHKDLESVGQAAVKAIERTHGTVYRVGPSASILYTASGTASDWAYEKAGIKYSYTIELRDTGTFGFLLPKNQIIPTGEETFNGLLAMIGQMEKNDRLLTSKSALLPTSAGSDLFQSMNNNYTTVDYSHVPDLDQLNNFSRFNKNNRPTFENVFDNGNRSPLESQIVNGARDRRPASENNNNNNELVRTHFDMYEPEPVAGIASSHRLTEENMHDDNEPDSGYAFEGEGELLEPTGDNVLEAEKITEARLSGRQDHSRRIVQAAGLTASGRNLINSPLITSRSVISESSPPKRESSDDVIRYVVAA